MTLQEHSFYISCIGIRTSSLEIARIIFFKTNRILLDICRTYVQETNEPCRKSGGNTFIHSWKERSNTFIYSWKEREYFHTFLEREGITFIRSDFLTDTFVSCYLKPSLSIFALATNFVTEIVICEEYEMGLCFMLRAGTHDVICIIQFFHTFMLKPKS